jgi:cytochrome c-type biogenesis protein CcmH
MANDTMKTIGMAGSVIALAGVAAWMGLAHGCEEPGGSGVISGRVTISAELASQVNASDVLFVIVKRPGGMPRPIAAKRIDHPQFPVTFEITNADVMIQGNELRGMVEVLARVDRDGQAGPAQPGDLVGQYERNPTLAGGRNLEIVINTVQK